MKLVRRGGCATRAAGRFRALAPDECARIALVAVAVCAIAAAVQAADRAAGGEPTSSRAAREDAVRSIPWRGLSAEDRRTAQLVIKDTSIYRRLPTRVIDCDPDLFSFLLQHPEVVIDVWRVMGISQVALERLPNGVYRGTDGAGTTGTVRYLFSNWGTDAQDLAVIHAVGAYEGKPFLKPLKAESIVLLRSTSVREGNGRHFVTVRVDSFIRIEQVGVELLAKSVQPWISQTADRNLIETLGFVSNFSRTAEKNPQGMQRLATRLESVDEPTRNELVAICFRTAERYAQQPVRRPGNGDLLARREPTTAIRSR